MAKIGLIDVDGHNFPNIALMKISNFHKKQGDAVEWVNYLDKYDKVYMSKVFTFTNDVQTCIHADEVQKGGTGYQMYETLFCDNEQQDYSIYPMYKPAYGFLTRGCIRSCAWCIVPKKEGKIRPYRDITEVLQGRKTAVLMDNNVLACDYGLKQIEKIIDLGCRVDFNQGLDAKLVTDEVAAMLARVKWIQKIRFACDTSAAVEPLVKATEKLNKYGVKNNKIFVYMLVKDVKEANERAEILKKMRVTPYAQPYRDFENNIMPTQEQLLFRRYVNAPAIFYSTDWQHFKP